MQLQLCLSNPDTKNPDVLPLMNSDEQIFSVMLKMIKISSSIYATIHERQHIYKTADFDQIVLYCAINLEFYILDSNFQMLQQTLIVHRIFLNKPDIMAT